MISKIKKSKIIFTIKRIIHYIILFFKYLYGLVFLKFNPIKFDVLSINDTIKYIIKNKKSIIRFGDGEFLYLNNVPILYQKYNTELSSKLKECLNIRNDNILVCIPETLNTRKNLVLKSKWHWTYRIAKDYNTYSLIDKNYKYGNAFISRPYIIYKNKFKAKESFDLLRQIWEKKKILLVEGKYSRSGVGNNLFENASSIKRIICPSEDAYDYYEQILNIILKYCDKFDIILLALGPTAKPLVAELAKLGNWALDIGHIDSEYEWFLKGSKKRETMKNKHTADTKDTTLDDCNDPKYIKSILEFVVHKNE